MIGLAQLKDKDRVLLVEAGRLHPAVTFTRASTATYMNGVGQIVTAAVNVPRFEYSAAGVYLGLLIEEARVNICLQSQNLSTAQWSYNNTTATVSATTYAGIAYYTLAKTDVNSSRSVSQLVVSVVSGTVHTLTFACRAGNSTQMGFGLNGSSTAWGGSSGTTVAIISGPGTLTQVTGNIGLCNVTGLSTTVDTVITMTRTYTASETARVYFYPDTASSLINGASNLVTRVQIEASPTFTSYIPTTTATVSRSADVATIPLTSIRYNSATSTLFVEFDITWTSSPTTRYVAALDSSGRFLYSPGGSLTFAMYDSTNTINMPPAVVPNTTTRAATAFSAAGLAGSVAGGTVVTSAFDGSFGAGSTTLAIGNVTGAVLNGHIKRMTYYPRRLTNTELRALSR